ncbi:MAG: hypothetical protein QOE06_2950 [Thermoleophilaceae bacterium]|nr:hypothetical protein [Thermoleophilaceae bacterium]
MQLLVHAAAASPPAGGAAIDQVIIATVAANVVAGGLAWVGMAHRAGKRTVLAPLAAFSERVSGLPAWAAIPSATVTGALLIALFGMLWDISLHIADGRDPGPLANPAHYFILAGLFGIAAGGFLAMVLPREKPSATAIRIRGDWYAPLGGVLITACGMFSLIGFPLDDVWHRLFGQDVTLWGPTHLMLIAGAAMTLVGLAVLLVEARRAQEASAALPRREPSWVASLRHVALPGGFLLGLSTFQAEFDFGVPQFRFVFEPMMVMLAAGVALVAARVWLGRGAALGAVLFFLALRGIIALLVGPVLGEPAPHFPLYLVEAGLVELLALRLSPRRPLVFGAVAGGLIGTIGLAAEWGWSHVFMPLPWPSALLPEAALAGFAVAIAGSLIGAWIGARLAADDLPGARTPWLRRAAVGSAVVLAGLTGWALMKPADTGVRGSVALTEASPAPNRAVNATVTITPRRAADDAEWLTATAWQGGDLVVDRLKRVGPGVYRTNRPIPVHGSWKALIRLHHGPSLTGIPVYLPNDPAIPARGVPAQPHFTRTFIADHKILQREQKGGSPALVAFAYGAVGAIALGFLALLAWGVHRLAGARGVEPPRSASPPHARRFARRRAVTAA